MKRFALRCLGIAVLVFLSVFLYTSLRHNKWLSVPVVRADGVPLKDLFEGLSPTEAGIYVRDGLRAEARRAKRASRPRWLSEFLDIFDNTVVHAEDLPGCDQTERKKETLAARGRSRLQPARAV